MIKWHYLIHAGKQRPLRSAAQARRRRAESRTCSRRALMNLCLRFWNPLIQTRPYEDGAASLLESLPRVGTNTAAVLMDEYKIACVASNELPVSASARLWSSVSADTGTLRHN